jgi:hypothetical protein
MLQDVIDKGNIVKMRWETPRKLILRYELRVENMKE